MGIEEPTISFSMLDWIPRILFLIIVFITVVIFITFYSKVEMNTFKPDSEMFVQRILNSPTGIAYHDPVSGRIYPSIIDLSKFEVEFKDNKTPTMPLLQELINYGQDTHIGAELILKDLNKIPLARAIYNPITYGDIETRGIKGPGGVDVKEKQIYVLIKKQDNSIIPGILDINVVVKRS